MIKGKVVVGIVPSFNLDNVDNDPYQDRAYFVRMYEEMIKEAGAIPIGLVDEDPSLYLDICDAYLWPGGNKINWSYMAVLDDALKNNKPLLGICLGMQAINTYFCIKEDSLKSNLSFEETYKLNKQDNPYLVRISEDIINNHSNYVTKDEISIKNAMHKIKIEKDSILYDIYKTNEIEGPSMHGIMCARVSSDMLVSARSEDNIIEAIEYNKNNNHILGVQYHVELINDIKLFNWLVDNVYNKYKILVNKENEIPSNISFNILAYDSKYPTIDKRESLMEENTYYAFLELKEKMMEFGYNIELESGYRYTCDQEELYEKIKEEKGEEHANKYVARPRHSEHETGLAIDICANIDGKWYNEFDKELDDMYLKLHEIISDYGFILRYPKDKESITKYAYEPWHLRYVGSKVFAKYIMDNNLTLEDIFL